MIGQVKKWGNSFALRIPKKIADELEWSENTWVLLSVESGKLVIEAIQVKASTLEELLADRARDNSHGENNKELKS